MGSPEHEIRYYTRGRGLLEFAGTGELRREDSDELLSSDTKWADIITTIKVSDGITGIGEGIFERFNALGTIMLSRTVETISATPELITTLKEKNVTIRSEYDTCAEEFAKANDLQFLHCDIPIAEDNNEKYHERDEITLRFHADSAPDILHDVYSTGSSAGNYGGGCVASELPENFYAGCTIEKFADNFPERIRDQIMNNEMLQRFLAAANARVQK